MADPSRLRSPYSPYPVVATTRSPLAGPSGPSATLGAHQRGAPEPLVASNALYHEILGSLEDANVQSSVRSHRHRPYVESADQEGAQLLLGLRRAPFRAVEGVAVTGVIPVDHHPQIDERRRLEAAPPPADVHRQAADPNDVQVTGAAAADCCLPAAERSQYLVPQSLAYDTRRYVVDSNYVQVTGAVAADGRLPGAERSQYLVPQLSAGQHHRALNGHGSRDVTDVPPPMPSGHTGSMTSLTRRRLPPAPPVATPSRSEALRATLERVDRQIDEANRKLEEMQRKAASS